MNRTRNTTKSFRSRAIYKPRVIKDTQEKQTTNKKQNISDQLDKMNDVIGFVEETQKQESKKTKKQTFKIKIIKILKRKLVIKNQIIKKPKELLKNQKLFCQNWLEKL